MPLVFPTNSSIGDVYDYGGIHYIYNGDGWVNKSIYGISAGRAISFQNYNGTGPVVISSTTVAGLSGAVGISAGQDMSISIVGNTLAFSSPTVYGISANIYASNLATGLLHGGIISINAGNTAQFDITSGRGQIHASGSTYTADPQPVFNYVTWPAQTGITVTNLATSDTTWLYIDSSGNVQQRTEYYTDEQLETTIIIGQLVHPSRTYINLARTNPNVAYATDKQYEQFIRSFGPIKVSGHSISPNGANLKLNRTSGKAFSLGRNWINNTDDPSVVSDPAQTDCTFFRYYRGATAGTFITVPNQTEIDPTKYDDGSGTLATVPGGKYTIQRLFYYPNTPTLLGVYYGRAEYNSISVAAANIDLENFSEIENTRTNAIFAGYLIVKSGATDLTNTADALIIQSGSFRSTSSGGGSVSITLDDLTDVIISSPLIDYQVLTYVDGLTGWENKSVSQLPLVYSFNGLSGAVQGVSSINGNTGAITNVAFTNTAQSFSGLQQFTQGISGSGGVTFYFPSGNTSIRFVSTAARYIEITPGLQNSMVGYGSGGFKFKANSGPLSLAATNVTAIGDVDLENQQTILYVDADSGIITFSFVGGQYTFPNTDGSANYVMKTDGAGALEWSPFVRTVNGYSGGVTFLAGSNITLTPGVPGITIAATSGGGGISRSISNISTDTSAGSAASTDYVYICTAGLTLTLPTAVSNTNRYSVKNNTASVVRIYTTSSQTIDGITFFNLNRQYQAIDLISDNSNWSIF